MDEGQISEMGSYIELMDRKEAFAKFIHTFNGNQRRDSPNPRDKSRISNFNEQKQNLSA